jgi:hypothetical protein
MPVFAESHAGILRRALVDTDNRYRDGASVENSIDGLVAVLPANGLCQYRRRHDRLPALMCPSSENGSRDRIAIAKLD